MGLYGDRLHDLSESRRTGGTMRRRAFGSTESARRDPMGIQSLLFRRDAGWTESKAKQWAKSHDFKHDSADVTDQYIRIRQFDPKGLKVKRTITLGRDIRAVVAREEDMRKRRRSTKAAASKPAFGTPEWRAMYPRKKGKSKRKGRRAAEVVQAKRPRRRVRRVRAATPKKVAAPRRRRMRAATTTVAARRRRKSYSGQVMETRRRRKPRRRMARAWRGDSPGHRKAAKKGWKRRKAGKARETSMAESRRRPRRRRTRAREVTYEARRPRRNRRRTTRAYETPKRRRYRTREAGMAKGFLKQLGMLTLASASAGVGFIAADWLDRILATYDPTLTGDKLPKDKFTSDGAGTLANTLNVAAPPHVKRIGAAVGMVLVPAVASVWAKNRYLKHSLEGVAVGAGVKAISLFWSNVLMPMLAPKGADPEQLKKSTIARLYPAEVAAKINVETNNKTASPQTSFGALSDPPSTGGSDVGPFALAGSSPYPDTAEALRHNAGMGGESPYPSAGQALRQEAGLGYRFEYHPHIERWRNAHPAYLPGGHLHAARWSQYWGHRYQPQYMIQTPHRHHHHHCMLRAKTMYPAYTDAQLHAWCHAHPHHLYPYLYEAPQGLQFATVPGVGQEAGADAGAPPPPPPPAPTAGGAAPPPAADAGAPPPPPAPAPVGPPAMAPNPVGPPTYAPGPGSTPGPGPVPLDKECGCGEEFLGFIGEAEEKDVLFSTSK
jgi:hypothetical protein